MFTRLASLAAIALGSAALSGCALQGSLDQMLDSPGAEPHVRTSLPGAKIDPPELFRKAQRSVVTVIAQYGDGADAPQGLGTGFAIDGGSLVVTNVHVVTSSIKPGEPADGLVLQLFDGSRIDAEIVGLDPHADIAVLKPAAAKSGMGLTRGLRFSSGSAAMGDPVMAIGSPLGETYTMSVGYVTGVDRRISGLVGFPIYGAIQTDAVITMGNSGGPMLNAAGDVIGVNGQMLSVGGGGEGLGFAIPALLVKRSVRYLRKAETVPYAYMGVEGKALWRGAATSLKLSVDTAGVLIGSVREGSPADLAGLRGGDGRQRVQGSDLRVGGDIITAINGRKLRFNEQLGEVLLEYKPGETVRVAYIRDGSELKASVTLEDRPVEWPSPLQSVFG